MIELPIASATPPSGATTETSQSMATEPNQPARTTASTAPYYAVQLAAYRSRGRAEGAWSKFQNASHGMLAAADHEVVSIAIEDKGLFFRLLTGNYGTAAAATQALVVVVSLVGTRGAERVRRDTDDAPILVDTGTLAASIRWNTSGSVLAVAGNQNAAEKAVSSGLPQDALDAL